MKRASLAGLGFVLAAGSASAAPFRRGDANQDGIFDISDAVKTLAVLFVGDANPGCDDALDSNDDGVTDITDGVYSLSALFTGGPNPKPPFPDCGEDPTGGDKLACDRYAPPSAACAVAECIGQDDIDGAIEENIPDEVCVPPEVAEVPVPAFQILVVVCPAALAKPCGTEASPGCPVALTRVMGTIDLPARKLTVHVEGHLEDFPVRVEDTSPSMNPPIDCTFDVDFSGDVVVPFTTAPMGADTKLTAILDPTVENVVLNITASPGFICALIASQKDQFIDPLKEQVLSAAQPLLEELRAQYVGQVFCKP